MFTGICEQNSITKRFKGAKVHFSILHFISLMYCNISMGLLLNLLLVVLLVSFFLICTQKTISMKILVLRVIKSSCHRKHFVQGCIHSLLVQKAHNRSYIARSGS